MNIAALLALSSIALTTCLTPSPARAADAPPRSKIYSLFAPKPVAPPINQDCPKDMTEAKFAQLLGQYPKIYHDKSAILQQWDLEDQVTNAVFCAVGTPAYVEYLRSLNDVAQSDQEAYYNLAKRLQAHWQTQYALSIAKVQAQRMQSVSDDSMKLSLLVTALSLFTKSSSQVPTLFYIIRQFFPVVLPAMAVGSTELANRYGLFEGHYPIPPAHIMKFPMPQTNTDYDWYDVEKNVTSAVLSVAGAQVASKIVGGLTEAITVGKVSLNPATILASFAVGYAVQDGSKYAIDAYRYHELVKKYLASRDDLERAVADKDYIGMRTSAENLKTNAIYLSSFQDQKSLNVWVDYDSSVKTWSTDPIWKQLLSSALLVEFGGYSEYLSPDQAYRKTKIEEAGASRDEKLETIQAAEDPVSLQDVQLEIAMNVMSTSPDNAKLLSGEQAQQAKIISLGFEQYKKSKAPLVMPEDQEYQEYLTQLNQDRDNLLVQQFMAGKVYKNPSYVLLQAAAYIRSLKQPVLS